MSSVKDLFITMANESAMRVPSHIIAENKYVKPIQASVHAANLQGRKLVDILDDPHDPTSRKTYTMAYAAEYFHGDPLRY